MTQARGGLGLSMAIAGVAALFVVGMLRLPVSPVPARRASLPRLTWPSAPAHGPSAPPPAPPGISSEPVPPAQASLPAEALNEEARVDGLRLPPSELYDLRCRFNAHAAGYTAEHLLAALAHLRADYRGQIVIGDVSRRDGGPFGRHRSHRTGRDVDIWLPVIGGAYRSDPACASCGTSWCRPEPEEVDWAATWALVGALAATGAVEHIFLDRGLHPELRAAGLAAGVTQEGLNRIVQRCAGAPALVLHSAGHTRHMHVRVGKVPSTDKTIVGG